VDENGGLVESDSTWLRMNKLLLHKPLGTKHPQKGKTRTGGGGASTACPCQTARRANHHGPCWTPRANYGGDWFGRSFGFSHRFFLDHHGP